jgi:hypothetical protein
MSGTDSDSITKDMSIQNLILKKGLCRYYQVYDFEMILSWTRAGPKSKREVEMTQGGRRRGRQRQTGVICLQAK